MKKTVLIVEDEPLHLERVKQVLKHHTGQYHLLMAYSIRNAFEIINKNRPDLIITDNRLPDGEGREILKRVRNHCPTILMTAYGNEQFAAEIMKEGALDYLVKTPEKITQLPGIIERSLREWHLIREQQKLKQELDIREKRYKSLFEESNDAIFIHTSRGEILEVNRRSIELLGYTREELVGRYMYEFRPRRTRHSGPDRLEETIRKGQCRFETTFQTRYGSIVDVDISSRVFDHEKKLIQGIVRDITERKKSEKKLREQREKYQKLVDNALAGIGISDMEENILFANETLARMFGYSREELRGLNLTSLIPPEAYHLIKEQTQKRKNNHSSIYETTLLHRDGSPIQVLVHGSPYRNSNGRIVGTIGVVIDLTRRKMAEQAVRRSEIFNREVINNVGEGIVVYDRELRYRFWNPFMEEITGKKADEVVGKYAPEIFPFLKEQGLDKLLKRALKGEQVKTHDVPFKVARTGRAGWASSLYTPHYDENGKIIGVIATITDITDKKRVIEELHNVNATKDRLISIIAHDLRNPISQILGFSELLIHKGDSFHKGKVQQFCHSIYTSTKALYDLFENLLEWSRVQRGTLDFKPAEVALKPVVEETMEIHRIKALRQRIQLINQVPESLYVWTDVQMLQTILRNLLSNALKYTGKNGRVVVGSYQSGEKVVFHVADDGIGMSPQKQNKLFEFSENISTRGVSGEKGTGLGLAICKEFVEKLGEKIWVRSRPDKGTTFYITLPKSKGSSNFNVHGSF